MWLFRFASVWICFGNAVGCAFVVGTAALYAYVLSEPLVSFSVGQLEASILTYFRPTILFSYLAVAGHGILAVRTARHVLQRFLRRRRPAIQPARRSTATTSEKRGPTPSNIVPAHAPVSTLPTVDLQLNPLVFRIQARARAHTVRIWKTWNRYGAEITRLFMIWEIANQTYQANKISRLIASVWINRLVALVIVLNCWFSPIVHYVMRGRRKVHVRLARLLLDSWLDFVYSIGIPLVIFYPYYRDYVGNLSIVPPLFYYMDTWYVNALSELRQVFVTSWIDLVSKATGSLALLHRLYILENVLKVARDPTIVSRRETTTGSRSTAATAVQRLTRKIRSRLTKILDAILMLWGLIILSLHVHATVVAMQGDHMGCLHEMRPWGASTYSCGVLEMSCVARRTTGQFPAIVDALDSVDPSLLQVLIVSHCEQLEVPPIIQDYSALSMIKVYNTTIASWGETAALRESTHPSLQVLYFARVNMSEIPAGLIARDFPVRVWDIEFCSTNLTTFPEAVVDAWQGVVFLVVEASPLIVEAPEPILKLPQVLFLQLGLNNIPSLPDWALADRDLVGLFLDGNPITQLPHSIKSLHAMQTLGIRDTQIQTLPATWLAAPRSTDRSIDVQASGSPLCSEASASLVGPFAIGCTRDSAPLTIYPIAEEDAWRAASARYASL